MKIIPRRRLGARRAARPAGAGSRLRGRRRRPRGDGDARASSPSARTSRCSCIPRRTRNTRSRAPSARPRPATRASSFHAAPDVTLEDDLRRRDLTINAMARADDGTLIDPYGGERDLRAGILRHVSDAFAEDPVRILRVARFAARFGFAVAPETMTLMAGAWSRRAKPTRWCPSGSGRRSRAGLVEKSPSRMIAVLRECGALARMPPEVDEPFSRPTCPSTLAARLDRAAARGYALAVRFALLVARPESAEDAATLREARERTERLPRRSRAARSCEREHAAGARRSTPNPRSPARARRRVPPPGAPRAPGARSPSATHSPRRRRYRAAREPARARSRPPAASMRERSRASIPATSPAPSGARAWRRSPRCSRHRALKEKARRSGAFLPGLRPAERAA